MARNALSCLSCLSSRVRHDERSQGETLWVREAAEAKAAAEARAVRAAASNRATDRARRAIRQAAVAETTRPRSEPLPAVGELGGIARAHCGRFSASTRTPISASSFPWNTVPDSTHRDGLSCYHGRCHAPAPRISWLFAKETHTAPRLARVPKRRACRERQRMHLPCPTRSY